MIYQSRERRMLSLARCIRSIADINRRRVHLNVRNFMIKQWRGSNNFSVRFEVLIDDGEFCQ